MPSYFIYVAVRICNWIGSAYYFEHIRPTKAIAQIKAVGANLIFTKMDLFLFAYPICM